jgi:hypothetical protein
VSAANNVKSQSSKDNQPKSIRSRARSLKSEDHMSEMEKETKIGRGKAKTPMKAAQDAQDRQPKDKCTFCICHEPDDGTPMVCCSVCNEWCVYAIRFLYLASLNRRIGIIFVV